MAMTVTATASGAGAQNGILLRLYVLTSTAASQAGAASGSQSSSAAHQKTVTTTQTGSRCYCAVANQTSNTSFTANANTTVVDNVADATQGCRYGSGKQTTATGTPGSISIGASSPSQNGSAAVLEILPNGTITEDGSGPAAVSSTSAKTVTTASFTPPAGALLVALASAGSTGSAANMTVSDTGGGYTWTEQVAGHAAAMGYAGVWTAQVPAASAAHLPLSVLQAVKRAAYY